MHDKTIAELSYALHHQQISSVELTQHYLNRIQQYDSTLNTFITVTADQALSEAACADQRIADGNTTPLTGIPLAHKDIFCTTGIKTTCASRMLDNFIAPYDATVVARLKRAGMVLVGKTNMDEFAMGSSNETSYYQPVKNPWDINRTPGGSSGGSAAAVAARLVPAATGTDTGGSIRQPAAFCNITGLKPTYGRVSRYGMIAFASSLDHAGPMTQTAEDAALLLNSMASVDERDATSANRPVPNYLHTLHDSLQGLKIGLPTEYFSNYLDSKVATALASTQHLLESLGAIFIDIHLPHTHLAPAIYHVLASAECSSNLARYDGIRYGYRSDDVENLDDLYKLSRTHGFGDEVKRRIMVGTYVLSSGHYEAYYLKAKKIRALMRHDFIDAFKTVDLIFAPTTPTPAFELGEKASNPIEMYLSDIYTIPANIAGVPAISFPIGCSGDCPIGGQLMGNYFHEARLLNVVHQYQNITDWHKKLPPTCP